MQLSKTQITALLTEVASQEDGFNEILRMSFEAMMKAERRDHVINLCEIKFSLQPFTITKAYAAQLQQKISRFKTETDTKKAVWLTMITTFGLTKNEYAASLVQKELTMEVLFG